MAARGATGSTNTCSALSSTSPTLVTTSALTDGDLGQARVAAALAARAANPETGRGGCRRRRRYPREAANPTEFSGCERVLCPAG
jgi:hypothetical protein